MFVVNIDVWPHGDAKRAIRQTAIVACNDGTGTKTEGNYQAITVSEKTSKDPARAKYALFNAMDAGTTAKVTGFPRDNRSQVHLPSLVIALITALGLDEVYIDWQHEVSSGVGGG